MIYIDPADPTPLYTQIYEHIVRDIRENTLSENDRLPSSRELAAELNVSRNTVNRVYQQLMAEGYVSSRPGSGIYIDPLDPGMLPKAAPLRYLRPQPQVYKYDFLYGTISNELFPYAEWRKCVNDALNKMELERYTNYPSRTGCYELKNELARYLAESRGVNCDPDNIVITCGYQASMEIIAGLFADPEKSAADAEVQHRPGILFEDPGYDGVRKVFENNHYRILPVRVDTEGLHTEQLSGQKAALLYLTPSHQLPTGTVIPIGKRQELIRWAIHNHAYIIEDDYDSELRYGIQPIPSMQTFDPGDHILYTGTFTKCLSATLRVAYLILTDEAKRLFEQKYGRYHAQVSVLIQYALAELLRRGSFEQNIRKIRNYYRRVQEQIIQQLYETFGPDITIYGAGAGLHVLVDFHTGHDCELLIASAAKAGIGIYSCRADFIIKDPTHPAYNTIKIGYGTIAPSEIAAAWGLVKAQWIRDGLWDR